MKIDHEMSEKFKSDVAILFINALGDKFLPILGDKNRAKRLLELSLNNENCFLAENASSISGFLAYQTNRTSFFSPSMKSIKSIYGVISGVIKFIGLSILKHKNQFGEIYIEAIAVNESSRGEGVGSKLIEEFIMFAKDKGFKNITLDVIDVNYKAIKLYERFGFEIVKRHKVWPVNKVLGWKFKEVLFMKKDITSRS